MPDIQLILSDGNIVKVGDTVRSTFKSGKKGICTPGICFVIEQFQDIAGEAATDDYTVYSVLIKTIASPSRLSVTIENFVNSFVKGAIGPLVAEEIFEKAEIKESYKFKNKNLKSLFGKVIKKASGYCFLELDENVGGGSADGLGKNGHCVAVPLEIVKISKVKAKECLENNDYISEKLDPFISKEDTVEIKGQNKLSSDFIDILAKCERAFDYNKCEKSTKYKYLEPEGLASGGITYKDYFSKDYYASIPTAIDEDYQYAPGTEFDAFCDETEKDL